MAPGAEGCAPKYFEMRSSASPASKSPTTNAVGFEAHGQLQVVGGDGLEVVGAVVPGGGVEVGADLLERGGDLRVALLVEVGRALEHHVFEQVRGARVADGLVARPHAVEDAEGRDRRHPVLDEQPLPPAPPHHVPAYPVPPPDEPAPAAQALSSHAQIV